MDLFFTIAQQQPAVDEKTIESIFAAFVAIALIIAAISLAVSLAISIAICAVHYSCLARVPAEYRKMEPWQVWLLMIPIFNLAWNFFVYQRIPESYQAYFAAKGIEGYDDCGKNMGLWYSICAIGPFVVPCVGSVVGLVALVLMIIFIVKEFEMRSKITRAAVT